MKKPEKIKEDKAVLLPAFCSSGTEAEQKIAMEICLADEKCRREGYNQSCEDWERWFVQFMKTILNLDSEKLGEIVLNVLKESTHEEERPSKSSS